MCPPPQPEVPPLPSHETVIALIQAYGLWVLAPFAILEGPIVTVVASYLAHQGALNLIGCFGSAWRAI